MTLSFLNPAALVLLSLVPVFIVFLLWRQRAHERRFRLLGDLALIERLVETGQKQRYLWRSALWLITFSSLVIAAARPVWGVNTDVIEVQGASVVVVLDVSNSMAAQDVLPSRLERAKLALYDLFDGLRGNEVALVLFAGASFVQFPLTTDIDTAQTFLSTVSTGAITQQGTVIEDALQKALDLFDTQRPSARIIVLATDGENQEGDVERVVQEAIERSVTIHTIGFGDSEGAPVPVLNDSGEVVAYKADAAGQMILSKLDEATLQSIASQTGGLYQRASASGSEIANLLHTISQAETGPLDNRVETRSVERFGIFLLAAFVALSLEIMLPGGRKAQS